MVVDHISLRFQTRRNFLWCKWMENTAMRMFGILDSEFWEMQQFVGFDVHKNTEEIKKISLYESELSCRKI